MSHFNQPLGGNAMPRFGGWASVMRLPMRSEAAGLDAAFIGVPQALEIIRGCRGLRLVGADLVEVSPPYDTSGNTALLGANLLYEMLCVLPGVHYR